MQLHIIHQVRHVISNLKTKITEMLMDPIILGLRVLETLSAITTSARPLPSSAHYQLLLSSGQWLIVMLASTAPTPTDVERARVIVIRIPTASLAWSALSPPQGLTSVKTILTLPIQHTVLTLFQITITALSQPPSLLLPQWFSP